MINTKMKKLGERNYELLKRGIGCGEGYVGAFYHAEESLCNDEAQTIFLYCKWLEDNDLGQGWGNYEIRFAEFLVANNVNKEINEKRIKDLTAQFEEFKNRLYSL